MRSLFLIWILVLGLLCPRGVRAQETHHKEVPTEGANEGVMVGHCIGTMVRDGMAVGRRLGADDG